MIVDHATQQIIASECHLDGKLYVYVEICKDEKHKFALAQNHQFPTSLLALLEVLGEVSLIATILFPNGEGSGVMVTSFEKKKSAPNMVILQGVVTSSNHEFFKVAGTKT